MYYSSDHNSDYDSVASENQPLMLFFLRFERFSSQAEASSMAVSAMHGISHLKMVYYVWS